MFGSKTADLNALKTKTGQTALMAELTDDIRGFKAPELAKRVLGENLLEELLKCALDKDHLLSSRAMWVLGHCSDLDSSRIAPADCQSVPPGSALRIDS